MHLSRSIALGCILLLPACGGAPPPPARPLPSGSAALVLSVHGLHGPGGTLFASLHDRADAFPGATPLSGGQRLVPVTGADAEVRFEGLAPGRYAVSLFHDQNGNGRLDSNWIGAPTEGYGASQNALPALGAPKFEENAIVVTGVTPVVVEMHYR
jgi:uncharacterized protein (DUF2141 family)